jgi:hypothetical protein
MVPQSPPCPLGSRGLAEGPPGQPALRLGTANQGIPDQSVSAQESSSAWARLLAKVYEVDPLRCPCCGSQMRLLAVITDTQQVLRILRHLIKTGAAPRGWTTPRWSAEPSLSSPTHMYRSVPRVNAHPRSECTTVAPPCLLQDNGLLGGSPVTCGDLSTLRSGAALASRPHGQSESASRGV